MQQGALQRHHAAALAWRPADGPLPPRHMSFEGVERLAGRGLLVPVTAHQLVRAAEGLGVTVGPSEARRGYQLPWLQVAHETARCGLPAAEAWRTHSDPSARFRDLLYVDELYEDRGPDKLHSRVSKLELRLAGIATAFGVSIEAAVDGFGRNMIGRRRLRRDLRDMRERADHAYQVCVSDRQTAWVVWRSSPLDLVPYAAASIADEMVVGTYAAVIFSRVASTVAQRLSHLPGRPMFHVTEMTPAQAATFVELFDPAGGGYTQVAHAEQAARRLVA